MMSFKYCLRNTYGKPVADLATSYSKCLEKLSAFKNHVVFNARCKKADVVPPSLIIRPPINTARGMKIADRASHQFLSERLRLANYRVTRLEDERKWTEIGLRRVLSERDMENLEELSRKQAESVFQTVKERHKSKFDRLLRDKNKRERKQERIGSLGSQKDRWVINLSQHTLTEPERSVLEKGFNFADAPRSIPRTQLIVGVESALQKCEDQDKAERARATVATLIRKAKPPRPNLTRDEQHAINTIRSNKEVTILQADKGNKTVLLDTSDYEKKAGDILGQPPFKEVKKNPTSRNEKRVNDCLKRLLEKKAISKATFNQLHVPLNGTRPPMFYGSIKLHKEGYPLRPIVSATGSATYHMAKFVSRLLTPYVRQTPSYFANTQDFIEELRQVKLDEDDTMVSFDVK